MISRRTGNATGVEAEIGRTFKAGGLEALCLDGTI